MSTPSFSLSNSSPTQPNNTKTNKNALTSKTNKSKNKKINKKKTTKSKSKPKNKKKAANRRKISIKTPSLSFNIDYDNIISHSQPVPLSTSVIPHHTSSSLHHASKSHKSNKRNKHKSSTPATLNSFFKDNKRYRNLNLNPNKQKQNKSKTKSKMHKSKSKPKSMNRRPKLKKVSLSETKPDIKDKNKKDYYYYQSKPKPRSKPFKKKKKKKKKPKSTTGTGSGSGSKNNKKKLKPKPLSSRRSNSNKDEDDEEEEKFFNDGMVYLCGSEDDSLDDDDDELILFKDDDLILFEDDEDRDDILPPKLKLTLKSSLSDSFSSNMENIKNINKTQRHPRPKLMLENTSPHNNSIHKPYKRERSRSNHKSSQPLPPLLLKPSYDGGVPSNQCIIDDTKQVKRVPCKLKRKKSRSKPPTPSFTNTDNSKKRGRIRKNKLKSNGVGSNTQRISSRSNSPNAYNLTRSISHRDPDKTNDRHSRSNSPNNYKNLVNKKKKHIQLQYKYNNHTSIEWKYRGKKSPRTCSSSKNLQNSNSNSKSKRSKLSSNKRNSTPASHFKFSLIRSPNNKRNSNQNYKKSPRTFSDVSNNNKKKKRDKHMHNKTKTQYISPKKKHIKSNTTHIPDKDLDLVKLYKINGSGTATGKKKKKKHGSSASGSTNGLSSKEKEKKKIVNKKKKRGTKTNNDGNMPACKPVLKNRRSKNNSNHKRGTKSMVELKSSDLIKYSDLFKNMNEQHKRKNQNTKRLSSKLVNQRRRMRKSSNLDVELNQSNLDEGVVTESLPVSPTLYPISTKIQQQLKSRSHNNSKNSSPIYGSPYNGRRTTIHSPSIRKRGKISPDIVNDIKNIPKRRNRNRRRQTRVISKKKTDMIKLPLVSYSSMSSISLAQLAHYFQYKANHEKQSVLAGIAGIIKQLTGEPNIFKITLKVNPSVCRSIKRNKLRISPVLNHGLVLSFCLHSMPKQLSNPNSGDLHLFDMDSEYESQSTSKCMSPPPLNDPPSTFDIDDSDDDIKDDQKGNGDDDDDDDDDAGFTMVNNFPIDDKDNDNDDDDDDAGFVMNDDFGGISGISGIVENIDNGSDDSNNTQKINTFGSSDEGYDNDDNDLSYSDVISSPSNDTPKAITTPPNTGSRRRSSTYNNTLAPDALPIKPFQPSPIITSDNIIAHANDQEHEEEEKAMSPLPSPVLNPLMDDNAAMVLQQKLSELILPNSSTPISDVDSASPSPMSIKSKDNKKNTFEFMKKQIHNKLVKDIHIQKDIPSQIQKNIQKEKDLQLITNVCCVISQKSSINLKNGVFSALHVHNPSESSNTLSPKHKHHQSFQSDGTAKSNVTIQSNITEPSSSTVGHDIVVQGYNELLITQEKSYPNSGLSDNDDDNDNHSIHNINQIRIDQYDNDDNDDDDKDFDDTHNIQYEKSNSTIVSKQLSTDTTWSTLWSTTHGSQSNMSQSLLSYDVPKLTDHKRTTISTTVSRSNSQQSFGKLPSIGYDTPSNPFNIPHSSLPQQDLSPIDSNDNGNTQQIITIDNNQSLSRRSIKLYDNSNIPSFAPKKKMNISKEQNNTIITPQKNKNIANNIDHKMDDDDIDDNTDMLSPVGQGTNFRRTQNLITKHPLILTAGPNSNMSNGSIPFDLIQVTTPDNTHSRVLWDKTTFKQGKIQGTADFPAIYPVQSPQNLTISNTINTSLMDAMPNNQNKHNNNNNKDDNDFYINSNDNNNVIDLNTLDLSDFRTSSADDDDDDDDNAPLMTPALSRENSQNRPPDGYNKNGNGANAAIYKTLIRSTSSKLLLSTSRGSNSNHTNTNGSTAKPQLSIKASYQRKRRQKLRPRSQMSFNHLVYDNIPSFNDEPDLYQSIVIPQGFLKTELSMISTSKFVSNSKYIQPYLDNSDNNNNNMLPFEKSFNKMVADEYGNIFIGTDKYIRYITYNNNIQSSSYNKFRQQEKLLYELKSNEHLVSMWNQNGNVYFTTMPYALQDYRDYNNALSLSNNKLKKEWCINLYSIEYTGRHTTNLKHGHWIPPSVKDKLRYRKKKTFKWKIKDRFIENFVSMHYDEINDQLITLAECDRQNEPKLIFLCRKNNKGLQKISIRANTVSAYGSDETHDDGCNNQLLIYHEPTDSWLCCISCNDDKNNTKSNKNKKKFKKNKHKNKKIKKRKNKYKHNKLLRAFSNRHNEDTKECWIKFQLDATNRKIISSEIINLPEDLHKHKWLCYDKERDCLIGIKRLEIEELLEMGYEKEIKLCVVPRLTSLIQQSTNKIEYKYKYKKHNDKPHASFNERTKSRIKNKSNKFK